MSTKKIKTSIFKLLEKFEKQRKKENIFTPGKSKVRYSGAFYNHKELIAMTDAMLNGWFGLGRYGEKFEQDLTKYINCHSTLLTNSGSSATLLCMSALTSDLYAERIERGSEVITPACTFATTAAAIVHQGLIPVFLDVDVDTFNIDPKHLESAITKKTRAIFLPHTLGNPNDMDAVMSIVKKHKLHLIEDNCDALGSTYGNQKTGSFGALGACSFYPAHHITAAGEGGAVFINDPRLQRVVLTYRNWGRGCWCGSLEKDPNGACRNRFNFKIDGIPVDHKYYFVALGYNLKPVEIQAAMGVEQLKHFPKMEAARKRNFAAYYAFFENYKKFFILPRSVKKADPCWFSFPLTLTDNAPFTRMEIVQFLEKNLVETRTVFAGNIVRQPAMRRVAHRVVGTLANSDKILKDTFFIGIGPHINSIQRNYILDIFKQFLKKF